jgi:spore coat protein H
MRWLLFLVFIPKLLGQEVHPLDNEAFLQNEVASIYIELPNSQLQLLLGDSLYTDHEFLASFRYQSSLFLDTISQVGFRVRGNTSRSAGKKSFSIDFNDFIPGQKFKGLDNMNLVGNHNDPSQLRAWLSNQILKSAGLTVSRTSFVRLYINNEYKGLYLNNEAIDDEFIKDRFLGNSSGNLFKCSWGSYLTYLGNNPQVYQETYDLKTNQVLNDYSGLIHFIDILNNTNNSEFPCAIQQVFDVDRYLKTLVYEILIGHWDGYAGNKNNYYLYQRPSDGKFVFIEYDMDNTFGIDWFNENWSVRNINNWYMGNRPLIQRLFAVPYYKDQFNFYMNEALTSIFNQDWLLQLQNKQNLISQAAFEDSYKQLDYGFTNSVFTASLTNAFGAHVTMSISDYMNTRLQNALAQVQTFQVLENPCQLAIEENEIPITVIGRYDLLGRPIITKPIANQIVIEILSNGKTRKTIFVD